jgi:hypothetical protein
VKDGGEPEHHAMNSGGRKQGGRKTGSALSHTKVCGGPAWHRVAQIALAQPSSKSCYDDRHEKKAKTKNKFLWNHF